MSCWSSFPVLEARVDALPDRVPLRETGTGTLDGSTFGVRQAKRGHLRGDEIRLVACPEQSPLFARTDFRRGLLTPHPPGGGSSNGWPRSVRPERPNRPRQMLQNVGCEHR